LALSVKLIYFFVSFSIFFLDSTIFITYHDEKTILQILNFLNKYKKYFLYKIKRKEESIINKGLVLFAGLPCLNNWLNTKFSHDDFIYFLESQYKRFVDDGNTQSGNSTLYQVVRQIKWLSGLIRYQAKVTYCVRDRIKPIMYNKKDPNTEPWEPHVR